MPDFEPDLWNQPNAQPFNNCYDYATNNRTEWHPPMRPPPPPPPPGYAIPGRTQGVTCVHVIAVPPGFMINQLSCKGIKTGCILDGLKEVPAGGTCEAGCWKVAYFVRPASNPPPANGDMHFARQDSDGTWSHKMGNGPAEKLPLPPPPLAMPPPEAPNAAPGYQFCGYLCCCPNTQVAMAPRERDETMGEVAMLTVYEGHSGVPMQVPDASGELGEAVASAVADLGDDWQDGIGPGTVLYSYNGGKTGPDRVSFMISAASATQFAGTGARHLLDEKGSVAAAVRKLLANARRA